MVCCTVLVGNLILKRYTCHNITIYVCEGRRVEGLTKALLHILLYVDQCCGNCSLQIINYNCNYLATLRTNYHSHYSNIISN